MQFPRPKLLALAGVLLLAGWGCAPQKANRKPFAWPWTPEPDDAVGITTPARRIEQMNQMQAEAAKQSPAEQQRITDDLSKQIQGEQDPLIRRHIIRTLGYYSTPVAATILKAGLTDADAEVRIASCEAWGRRGGKEAVDMLSTVLATDTNVDVRLAAARAIGQTHDSSALSPLAEALVDANPAIQHRVAESLKQVSGKDFGYDVNSWRAYAKGETVPEPEVSLAERLRRMF